MDYSGGLDLMFYEGSTVSGITKKGVMGVVDVSNPEQSLLLKKTLRGVRHAGGGFWSDSAPDYLALRQWITEGARKN